MLLKEIGLPFPPHSPPGFTTERWAAQKRYFALKLPVAGGGLIPSPSPMSIRAMRPPWELNSWGSGAWTALGCDPRQGAAGWR